MRSPRWPGHGTTPIRLAVPMRIQYPVPRHPGPRDTLGLERGLVGLLLGQGWPPAGTECCAASVSTSAKPPWPSPARTASAPPAAARGGRRDQGQGAVTGPYSAPTVASGTPLITARGWPRSATLGA